MSDIVSTAKRTICITCHHISHFRTAKIPTVPSFLRMLATKNGGSVCSLKEPLLEQPNIVYGVTAGGWHLNNTRLLLRYKFIDKILFPLSVLSYAEFMELPSVLYILYTDTFVLDSLSADPLLKLFSAMDCIVHDVAFTGKNFFNKGNLYM